MKEKINRFKINMTYQERLDMFAAAALSSGRNQLCEQAFEVAQLMIKESDRICAEKK